ncbi:hypothetical protein B0I35DRAFT_482502 [Stachybotrys elegans]|uniref:SnoaL-like domain-containing protein n=1 Tax=Stachybotrys elegans TaxID=80388 RepID=A0A8K0SEG7_9HYPO|nr:hypothetical protein B0I35DRAFT_482502 [Stachybotrys elegans]
MSSIRENLLKIVDGYLEGFNTNTLEGLIALCSPDCKHTLLPAAAGHPVFSNEEYQAFIGRGLAFMKNFQLKLAEGLDPIIDEQARKIVIYLTSTAESPAGNYANEYTFMFETNDAVTEIVKIVEFVDTATTAAFMKKVEEFMAGMQAQ